VTLTLILPGQALTPNALQLTDHARRLRDDAEQDAALFKHSFLADFTLHTANNNLDEAAPLASQLTAHFEETLAASSDLDLDAVRLPSLPLSVTINTKLSTLNHRP